MNHNNTCEGKERFFSIELESKTSLKNATLADAEKGRVLLEGTIGNLQRAAFEDGVVLEVIGTRGVLRINLLEKEITKMRESVGGAST